MTGSEDPVASGACTTDVGASVADGRASVADDDRPKSVRARVWAAEGVWTTSFAEVGRVVGPVVSDSLGVRVGGMGASVTDGRRKNVRVRVGGGWCVRVRIGGGWCTRGGRA